MGRQRIQAGYSQRPFGGVGRPTSCVAAAAENPGHATRSSTEGDPKKGAKLTPAKTAGDIFFLGATFYTYSHGHVGIYVDKDNVAEAPGPKKKTRKRSRKAEVYLTDVVKLDVKTKKETRDKAIKWALGHLGKDYNNNFVKNKQVECPASSFLAGRL